MSQFSNAKGLLQAVHLLHRLHLVHSSQAAATLPAFWVAVAAGLGWVVPPGTGVRPKAAQPVAMRPKAAKPANPPAPWEVPLLVLVLGLAVGAEAGTGVAAGTGWMGAAAGLLGGLLLLVPVGRA